MDNNIYIDTNILIDFILNRAGFYNDSKELLRIILKYKRAYVSALSFHIIMYITKSDSILKEKIRRLLMKFEVLSLDRRIVFNSFKTDFKDYEDILQFNSAVKHCNTIVTRDKKDYVKLVKMSKKKVNIYTPREWLKENSK